MFVSKLREVCWRLQLTENTAKMCPERIMEDLVSKIQSSFHSHGSTNEFEGTPTKGHKCTRLATVCGSLVDTTPTFGGGQWPSGAVSLSLPVLGRGGCL